MKLAYWVAIVVLLALLVPFVHAASDTLGCCLNPNIFDVSEDLLVESILGL